MRCFLIVALIASLFSTMGCGGGGGSSSTGYTITDGWVTAPDGLRYRDDKIGDGNKAYVGSRLTVDYRGWLDDGTVFDSSIERGQPFTFTLGTGQVIPGWDEGLVGVRGGSIVQLIIPPELAYGEQGQGSIPPNATLHFWIEIRSEE